MERTWTAHGVCLDGTRPVLGRHMDYSEWKAQWQCLVFTWVVLRWHRSCAWRPHVLYIEVTWAALVLLIRTVAAHELCLARTWAVLELHTRQHLGCTCQHISCAWTAQKLCLDGTEVVLGGHMYCTWMALGLCLDATVTAQGLCWYCMHMECS